MCLINTRDQTVDWSMFQRDFIIQFILRYNADLELEDAVHTAILTLKEGFEGQMTEDNIEIGICTSDGFRKLNRTEVKDYLAALN